MNNLLFRVCSGLSVFLPGVAIAAQPWISEYSVLHVAPHFNEVSGEQLFHSICQGCHMSEGQGAEGAGSYPVLANNKKLEASGYPIYLVLEGSGNMPAFKKYLTDQQVMEVVSYIRTHLGNHAQDRVGLDQVRAISHR